MEPGLRFYNLRHTCITKLAEGQVNEQTITAIAGHVIRKIIHIPEWKPSEQAWKPSPSPLSSLCLPQVCTKVCTNLKTSKISSVLNR
jgi:hypothetical protein